MKRILKVIAGVAMGTFITKKFKDRKNKKKNKQAEVVSEEVVKQVIENLTAEEKVYTIGEVAEQVGVKKEKITDWALKLEKAGYLMERGENRVRLYKEEDIEMLINFKTAYENGEGKSQPQVAKEIVDEWLANRYGAEKYEI